VVFVTSPPLELIRDFINTLDVEAGVDQLISPSSMRAWLHGKSVDVNRVTTADMETARELRESLRALALANHEDRDTSDECTELCHIVAPLTLSVVFVDGTPQLVPTETGVRGFLQQLLTDAVTAAQRGEWDRLKVCPDDACQWAFIDTSKNGSRRWCSMEVCGNRNKTRSYRSRKAD
jgi:predicted RNA-binding Zn ribbon-like protein